MLVQRQSLAQRSALPSIRSFLLWLLTLTVWWLAWGIPLGLLVLASGLLGAVLFPQWLPLARIFAWVTTVAGASFLFILGSAAVFSCQRLNPSQVRGLRWLKGSSSPVNSVCSACALTCELPPLER